MKNKNRKIFINHLMLMASIGVYEQEKKNKQKIIINLEVLMTNGSEPKVDNLQATQDYSQFRKIAKEIADSQHFELIEILANKIHLSINNNKFVIGSKVNICKPSIFDDCEVAYELSNI
jgi:7,8-dihydroneopterin aldolase/epimerase/oxygenase